MRHVVHVLTVAESLAFLRGQPAYMRERGYRLSIVTSPAPALDSFGAREHVHVHGVEMVRRIAPRSDARSLVKLAALLRRIHPDIVHAHTPKGGLLGMLGATAAGVARRIYHMRGLPLMTATGVQRRLLTAAEMTSCRLASRVIAVSNSLREVAIERGLCAPEKIDILAGGSGQGVDCARFDPARFAQSSRAALRRSWGVPESALVIGFVGRLVRDKGVVELERAFARIARRRPDVHLVVAGPFEERDPVPEATRRALETNDRIHLIGFVEDTPRFYSGVDLVVLPTYREGFPNVPLETAAMRLPIVATRIPGCVDAVVDGVTGTLVPPRDDVSLADAIDAYLDNDVLRRAHASAARERVETSFRQERLWEALADVYDDLDSA